jgi:hypothetical protein
LPQFIRFAHVDMRVDQAGHQRGAGSVNHRQMAPRRQIATNRADDAALDCDLHVLAYAFAIEDADLTDEEASASLALRSRGPAS